MKPALWGLFLLLLLASSALIASSYEVTTKNGKNPPSSNNVELISCSDIIMKGTLGKVRVTEHKITNSELQQLKNSIGVCEAGQKYTQLVDGYGTGLRPPTEEEWAKIGASSYLVDSVDYAAGDGAPAAVDQSATPWFPPIGSQGSQGSCVAWSVGYYVKTFQEAQEHGWDLSGATWTSGHPTTSYQNKIISPAFVYNLINGGTDAGSSYYDAMQLVCFIGACSWEKMPYNLSTYTAWPSEAAWTEAALYRGNSSGYQYMSLSSDSGLSNLKNWIASGHLATISVDANKYSGLTSADMWTLDNYKDLDTNHANTIVGYNDSLSYTENGTVHTGAFKIANSWGVGGWEKIANGFYWISYEAMKQRVGSCMFYYDMIDYQPELLATFEISHQKRSECDIRIGMGKPNAPDAVKSFSQYVKGGTVPFPSNSIVMDVTELVSNVSNVYGKLFWLRVQDGGTSTIGNVTRFAVDHQESADAPLQTVQGQAIYLNVTLSFGQILVNSRIPPSTANQQVVAGGNVSLFFGGVQSSSSQFHLLLSTDNLSQVPASDTVYTPWFNLADLNASAVTAYSSANGAWQVGYSWVNGTVPTSIAGGKYFFKASDDSPTAVSVSDTSITVVGTLQVTPTSGPAGAAITINGYALSASSSVNVTYLNPVTLKWVSIINNTSTDTAGHFTYATVAPDLMQNQPAGDTPALFDAIVFRAQDNTNGAYCNASVPFNEFRRGLTQIGTAVAAGLYGNNTDLTPTVQVLAGRQLIVAGAGFAPGNVMFFWDGANLDAAVANESGYFSKALTVPVTNSGSHTVRITDANADFPFTVTVLPSPVSSDNYDGLWHTSDFMITLTCADDGNGIGTTYYRINNGPLKTVTVDGQPVITTEGANNILEYWSIDGAGVEELPHKLLTQIKLDKTAPTGSLKIDNGAGYTSSSAVTLTLTATDTVSGISQVRFSNDGVWDTEPWEAFATAKTWVLTSDDGLKTVYCQIKDNAGLTFAFSSAITLDTTKPVAHAGQDQTVNSGSSVTFNASDCTDIVGITSYDWDFGDGTKGNGKTATHTYAIPGTYTATLTVQDAAGNTATSSLTVTVQANVIPECPLAILPLLLIVLSLLVAIIYRQKREC